MRPTRGRGLGAPARSRRATRAAPRAERSQGKNSVPGVELGHGHEVELERRHDAEVAATALQGPQQVGLVLGVRADPRPVGEDDVRRGQRARGEAVRPAVPAEPAAERVADDADVGREAVQRREPSSDAGPTTSLHSAPAPTRAVRAATSIATSRRPVVLSRSASSPSGRHRRRAVARELRGDRQAALGGVPHGGDDVVRVLRHGHRGGTLVVEEVERRPVGVPRGIARRRDAKRHPRHALTARPVASARAATRARGPPRPVGATTASRRARGTRPAAGGSGSRPSAAGTPRRGRDERDEIGPLQQERREQEALDAHLDAPLHAEPREVQVGERDRLPGGAHRVDQVPELGVRVEVRLSPTRVLPSHTQHVHVSSQSRAPGRSPRPMISGGSMTRSISPRSSARPASGRRGTTSTATPGASAASAADQRADEHEDRVVRAADPERAVVACGVERGGRVDRAADEGQRLADRAGQRLGACGRHERGAAAHEQRIAEHAGAAGRARCSSRVG